MLSKFEKSVVANMGPKCDDMYLVSLLAAETGEVASLFQKDYAHDKPLNREALKLELGDLLWAVTALTKRHGMTLKEVAKANMAKLAERHPNGFAGVKQFAGRNFTHPKHPGKYLYCWSVQSRGWHQFDVREEPYQGSPTYLAYTGGYTGADYGEATPLGPQTSWIMTPEIAAQFTEVPCNS